MVKLEDRLGYAFHDKALLREALTHASSVDRTQKKTYERLEFLGDRVLGLCIADMLYRKFPEMDEGDLAPRLTALVRAETCALVAETLKMGDDIILGESEMQSGGRGRPAILADACEAMIGAIYLDGGWEEARNFVTLNWQAYADNPPLYLRDAKTMLQEWSQAQGYDLPQYEMLKREGPDHAPQFVMQVKLAALEPTQGAGASKRIAEQDAAEKFLKRENAWLAK